MMKLLHSPIAWLVLGIATLTATPAFADTTVVTVRGAAAVPVTTYHTVVVPVTHRVLHTSLRCAAVAAYAYGFVAYRQACVPVTWFSYFTTYQTVTVAETHAALIRTVRAAAITTYP
jgi:hypothetical protein